MPATGISLPRKAHAFCGTLEKKDFNSEKCNIRQHSWLIHEVRFNITPPVHKTHFEIKFET